MFTNSGSVYADDERAWIIRCRAHCVTNMRKNLRYERKNRDPEFMSEPVFVNVYGAQESIPRNRISQPICSLPVRYDKKGCLTGPQAGNRFLSSLKGLKIRAQV
jgi:hypothetical protein